MKAICILFMCAMVAACGPSCEERGGKLEFSYFMPILMPTGNGGHYIMQQPVYNCVIPTGEK